MATPRTVALHTLGCKLNFSETSQIGRQFQKKGYGIVPFKDVADIYVINTCSVTDFADRKCRKAIRDARKNNSDALVIVTGCYAQLKPQEIAQIEGVNLVLGAGEKFKMLQYIDEVSHTGQAARVHCGDIEDVAEFRGSFSVNDRTRTFLKVQDGCDYNCSFCTIPLARGASRSMPLDNVVSEVLELAKNTDVKEIVLTGINLGDYGLELREADKSIRANNFLDLIRELDKIDGIERFRISSIEPNLCTDEIIEFVSESNKFMPHFHMPLQSGSNEMLALMRRRYKKELFYERVQKIKSLMPHAAIGIDVIVGFSGETEDHFKETFDFLNDLNFTYLHVFTYSERANTPAENFGNKVPMEERRKRNSILRALSIEKKINFYNSFLNVERVVLVEGKENGEFFEGYTDNYIRVLLPKTEVNKNDIVRVQLQSINEQDLVIGRID